MTWHPTTNLIQTDLLTEEQLAELKAWPHGYEYYFGHGDWEDGKPTWFADIVYRGKPAPVVTSVWFNVYRNAVSIPHISRGEADIYATKSRIDILRIDTSNGVSTAHLEGLK
jgi:hypothetical protein